MNTQKLKRNDVVNVYQKPITDENLEGAARLYRHHPESDDPEAGERWTVVFPDDGMFVDRWVHARNLVREESKQNDD